MTESRIDFDDEQPRGGGIGVALLLLIPMLLLAIALFWVFAHMGVR